MKQETLDLGALITDMQPMLERIIGEKIELALKPAAGPCIVKADRSQIEQVVMNLVVNARDAMPDGGRISLGLRTVRLDATDLPGHPVGTPGAYVLLAVSDTGIGMDDTTRRRMFEPLFTTKEPGKGTGLGLATVWGIVQQSQGNICAESEPGKGTVVKVYLPSTRPAADPSRGALDGVPAAATAVPTATILVVEDEEGLRLLAEHVLTAAGHAVLSAASGDQALEISKRHDGPIHLLLTDVVLPGIDGPELAARLAVTRPQIKVLYTSGYTADAVLRGGVANNSVQFIGKPWSIADLRNKVREVLDG